MKMNSQNVQRHDVTIIIHEFKILQWTLEVDSEFHFCKFLTLPFIFMVIGYHYIWNFFQCSLFKHLQDLEWSILICINAQYNIYMLLDSLIPLSIINVGNNNISSYCYNCWFWILVMAFNASSYYYNCWFQKLTMGVSFKVMQHEHYIKFQLLNS